MIVNFVTSCEKKCGIAIHSRNFLKAKTSDAQINLVCLPRPSFNPFSYLYSGFLAGKNCDIIHIQYQQGIFGHLLPLPKIRAINHFPIFLFFIFFYKFFGKKIIYTIHESNPSNPWQHLVLFLMKLTADKILIHSEDLSKMLIQKHIAKDKIEYVPLPTLRREILKKSSCKKKIGINPDSFVILLFGFIHENKGFDLVLPILPKLPANVDLIIAGSARTGEHKKFLKSLKKTASDLHLDDRVHFFDYVPDDEIPVFLNSADLAVLPYRWIQTSAVLADFLACSLPVLTSDLIHFQNVKEKYGCIETFKTGDSDDLFSKINHLLKNPDKLSNLSSNSKKFMDASNSSKIFSDSLKIYSHLLSD
ncbi:glycosyltransferase [Candidatus Micrarchaeota archaeon]|nr:glycosyltransferase [Candidatus Micrarchaeota archaeon]MBU1681401.1 glycosyltransferase [Candidatus Micrarchaeota archaeon]